jgi:LysR family transcriptional regulator, nitrogen assimilation regulatory protein
MSTDMSLSGLANRQLDLRELRCFHSVASIGSIARAARALNVTNPNVSHHIQKLEDALGARLLIRHRKGITLTEVGSLLMERVEVLMGLLNLPLAQVPTQPSAISNISVAVPSEFAPFLVPRLLKICESRWPEMTLVIKEGPSASLEEWVLDRRVDIAVLQDPPTFDELDVEPVARERLGLVSDVRDMRETGPIRVRSLADMQLILPHSRHWIRREVESAAYRRGIVLRQNWQIDCVPLTKEMVRSGLGHTVLPLAAVRDEIDRGILSFRLIEHDPLGTVHTIACRHSRIRTPLVAEVRGLLRDLMSGLARSGAWAGAVPIGAPPTSAGLASRQMLEAAIG